MADEQATANGRERTARKPSGSPWSPFRHSTFTVLWTATVVANIGIWMYNAGSGWLMTSLNADPFVVSLVQAATSLRDGSMLLIKWAPNGRETCFPFL